MAESEAKLTEIPAGEILGKIEKGEPVEYDHVRVIGDLDITNLGLRIKNVDGMENLKVVFSSIKITNSTFNGQVKSINIFFENSIDFTNTTFSGPALFGRTIFRLAYFYETIFNENADFNGATFSVGPALFVGATFSGIANFREATFGEANFNGARFSRVAYFDEAVFGWKIYFWEATFSENSFFNGATGHGKTYPATPDPQGFGC